MLIKLVQHSQYEYIGQASNSTCHISRVLVPVFKLLWTSTKTIRQLKCQLGSPNSPLATVLCTALGLVTYLNRTCHNDLHTSWQCHCAHFTLPVIRSTLPVTMSTLPVPKLTKFVKIRRKTENSWRKWRKTENSWRKWRKTENSWRKCGREASLHPS